MSGSPATPIVYNVEILRQGKSYVTCSVKAFKKGNIIFVLMCSFQKPEPWQPSHQWTMPTVPPPEDCLLEEDLMLRESEQEGLHPKIKHILATFAEVSLYRHI